MDDFEMTCAPKAECYFGSRNDLCLVQALNLWLLTTEFREAEVDAIVTPLTKAQLPLSV